MATLVTPNKVIEVADEVYASIEKERSSVLGLMRRVYQQEQTYKGYRRIYGDSCVATQAKHQQWQKTAAKLAAKSAALKLALVKIEQSAGQ